MLSKNVLMSCYNNKLWEAYVMAKYQSDCTNLHDRIIYSRFYNNKRQYRCVFITCQNAYTSQHESTESVAKAFVERT